MARVAERKKSAQISRAMALFAAGDEAGANRVLEGGRQDGANVASAVRVQHAQEIALLYDGYDGYDGPDDAPDPYDVCEDSASDCEADGEGDTSEEEYAQCDITSASSC